MKGLRALLTINAVSGLPSNTEILKTWYCPLSIASCDLLAAIFVMLKILRLLFVGRVELFNNNGRLAPVKTKTTRGTQSIMANTGPLRTLK